MARLKKKPNYNPDTIMQELISEVSQWYLEAGTKASIRQIADEFEMTPLKIRKLLITAGVFSSELCDQVQELSNSGKSVSEIQTITGLSRASVHSYLPYRKIIYNAEEISQNAERIRLYRKRKSGVHSFQIKLKECGDSEECMQELWEMLKLFEQYPFHTIEGYRFLYQLKEKEIWIVPQKKRIGRECVMQALKKAMALQDKVHGPKQLEVLGADYLYPVFRKIGLIEEKQDNGTGTAKNCRI